MIRKVLLGSILWTLLISVLHVQLNVGWSQLARELRLPLGEPGEDRAELVVGFLPVT